MLQDHATSIKNQGVLIQSQPALLQSHNTSLRALDGQVGQIVVALQERQPCRLLSETGVTKCHGKEQYSSLTLRSGTQINVQYKFGERKMDDSTPDTVQAEHVDPVDIQVEEDKDDGSSSEIIEGENKNSTTKVVPTPSLDEFKPSPPLPQRLMKHNDDIQFKKFVDILDQLYINVHFLEAIEQIPTYVKYLKDIVTNKRKIEKYESIATTKTYCSALCKLAPKQNDPDSFFILFYIGENYVRNELFDHCSSVNLMLKPIFLMLGLGNTRPTSLILQLDDRSHIFLEGQVEDVIFRVEKFVFLVDLLIPDFKVDSTKPIILWRPFLATGIFLLIVRMASST
ncbi:uncharacterized protein LOC120171923 [Hibiscus syriacus]|uniref:uncharacterized protein LOC120171923 n=1 Tax=Hibiscus syriacus TaxID=106335 RepID=UPI00192098D6|nr:uncharacterized protein LOC120171923 [Hibiscus syriacus]